jgi:predicted small metal-binding protein
MLHFKEKLSYHRQHALLIRRADMAKVFSYACADYPGMESCPAHFHVETKEELMDIMVGHAIAAHGESPDDWTEEERAKLKAMIKED